MIWKAGTLPISIWKRRFFLSTCACGFCSVVPAMEAGVPCEKSPALKTISPFSRRPESTKLQGMLQSISDLVVFEEQGNDPHSLFFILQ